MGSTGPGEDYTPLGIKNVLIVFSVFALIALGIYLASRPPKRPTREGKYICVTSSGVMHDDSFKRLEWEKNIKIAAPSDEALLRLLSLDHIEGICIEQGFFQYDPNEHADSLGAIPASALRDISLVGQWSPEDIATIEKLTELDVAVAEDINSLQRIRARWNKPSFYVARQCELDAMSEEELRQIKSLYLMGRGITDLSSLKYCTSLKRLDISQTRVKDISPLAHCKQLEYLKIGYYPLVRDIAPLAECPRLNDLQFQDRPLDCSPLAGNTKLRSLQSARFRTVDDFAKVRNLCEVSNLHFDKWPEDNNFESLNRLRRLSNIKVADCSKMTSLESFGKVDWPEYMHQVTLQNINSDVDLSPLANMRSEYLKFIDCKGVRLFAFLKDKLATDRAHHWKYDLALQGLSMVNCPNVRDLSSLKDVKVNTLSLDDCQGIDDLTPLIEMRSLHMLFIKNCDNVKTISFLRNTENLAGIDITGCIAIPAMERSELRSFLSKRNHERAKAKREQEAESQNSQN